VKAEQFENAIFEKNEREVQCWFFKTVVGGGLTMRSSGPTLATFSVTHASPVASVGPLTRLLDRRIPQCDDSNRIRRGVICSVRRGGSVRLVYPEVEVARGVVTRE
jgi:hypothetical protein